jgi:hypothetical protein
MTSRRLRSLVLLLLGLQALLAARLWAAIAALPFMVSSAEVHVLAIVLWWRDGHLPWTRPDGLPLIQNPYGPVFEWVALALPPSADAPYTAGRLLSIACALATLALIALWTHRRGASPWLAAVCALLPLGAKPILLFAPLYRVDSLGLLASVAGFVLVTLGGSAAAIAGAAVLFVIAFATKATLVAAPLACFLWLWPTRRRAALALAALVTVGFVGCVAGMELLSDGGYLFNAAWANAPMDLSGPPDLLGRSLLSLFWLVALLLWPGSRAALLDPRSPAVLYTAASLGLALVLAANPNMSWNYLMEAYLALALLSGEVWRNQPATGDPATRRSLVALAAHALVSVILVLVWSAERNRDRELYRPDYAAARAAIEPEIEAGRRVLVRDWLAGRDVLNRLARPNLLNLPAALEQSDEVSRRVDAAIEAGEIDIVLPGTELSPRSEPWQHP